MLIFIDESYQVHADQSVWTALAAVCLPRENSREIARELYNLKRRFWREKQPCDIELKGSLLLNPRAIELPRNRDFVQQLVSLCRLYDIIPLAVAQRSPEGMELSRLKETGNLPDLHKAILRRAHAYLKNQDGRKGLLFFDERERETNRRISRAFETFLFRTREGQEMHEIIETPFFYDSSITPAGQIADIVAYLMCARYAGRRNEAHFERLFLEFRHMTHTQRNQEGKTMWGFSALGVQEEQSDQESNEKGIGDLSGPEPSL